MKKLHNMHHWKLKINNHKEQINIVVIDLNNMDMFLGYDWLVKYNLEVN